MGTDQKHRTLIFPPPLSGASRASVPDSIDAGWDDATLAAAEPLSSASVIPDEPEFDEDERPSGRKTIPNELAPNSGLLSASDLESDPSDRRLGRGRDDDDSDAEARALATTRPPPPPPEPIHPTLQELALALQAPQSPIEPIVDEPTEPIMPDVQDEPAMEMTPSSLPPISLDVRPPLTSFPGELARSGNPPRAGLSFPSARTAALFAGSNFAVGALVLAAVYVMRPEPKPARRAAHVAIDDRVPFDLEAGGSTPDIAPLDGCKVQDLARLIATRAELGPGLDASALESGFGVGLAATATEAVGLRLDADTLRTAETIRLKTPWPFAHVTVDSGDDPDARMDVHVDGIYAKKGGVFGRDGHLLWPLPGPIPKGNEPIRAALRVDGTSVVAVRRTAHFWVGVEGSGPMVPILRPHKQLGMPALTATNDGGVVAWAERGASAFNVYAATITSAGKHTSAGVPMVLAEGMSPAIATLPNGELLLTYADGSTGAHRVVAQRLGPDLDPRGELLVVSSDITNAGQPAVAVDSEGRAVVAFVAFAHGRAEVHATQLLCR